MESVFLGMENTEAPHPRQDKKTGSVSKKKPYWYIVGVRKLFFPPDTATKNHTEVGWLWSSFFFSSYTSGEQSELAEVQASMQIMASP